MRTKPPTSFNQLASQLSESVGGAEGEAPRDSIEGAVQALLHAVVDGIVSQTPRNMQTTSSVNRGKHPVQIELKGKNSQGLLSKLVVVVDLDQGLLGIRAGVQLMLFNAQGTPVANPGKVLMARRTDSVKVIVQQFKEWLGQAEALQMAPVAQYQPPQAPMPGARAVPPGNPPPAQPAALL